jgi:RNA polymerase sigma-70 factor, ECF subfamily
MQKSAAPATKPRTIGRHVHLGDHRDHPATGPAEPPSTGLDDGAGFTDAWLVEHARHGDHHAFAALVRRYERKLIHVLTRLVREPEQARDLAQETFWRIYTCLDRFDTARRFGPWLFRVGINLALDWLRSKPNELAFTTLSHSSWHRPGGRPALEFPDRDQRLQAELAQEVQVVLALLPISYRAILVLRDLEGFSSSEVAAIVGKQEATVRWRLYMAREKFREIWARRQGDGREKLNKGRASRKESNAR